MTRNLVAAAALAAGMTLLATPVGALPAGAQQDDGTTGPAPSAADEPDRSQGSPIEVTLALNPAVAVPGQPVVATAACAGPGRAALTAPVLEPVVLTADPEGHQPWALRGTTTVAADARPGDYQVSADCDDRVVTATLTVLPGGDGGVDRVPAGAPETGGGPAAGPPDLLLAAAGLGGLGVAGLVALAARRAARR